MKTISKNELIKKTEVIKATLIFSAIGTVLLFKAGSVLGASLYHWVN